MWVFFPSGLTPPSHFSPESLQMVGVDKLLVVIQFDVVQNRPDDDCCSQ